MEDKAKINGNANVFPVTIEEGVPSITYFGLTKREYFAGLAMQGLLANSLFSNRPSDISEQAIKVVDELLKQLEE